MKKFLVLLVVLLGFFSGSILNAATTITWKATNQATVAWDVVNTFDDNSAFPAGTTIQYGVYTRKDIDPPLAPPAVQVTTVNVPTATITFATEGKYYVGVQSLRFDTGVHNVGGDSTIAWSDVDTNCQGGVPFGFTFYKVMKQPKGLR
jgi:hypothetical protein